jgi:uncharacterized protein (TIGR02145 family)
MKKLVITLAMLCFIACDDKSEKEKNSDNVFTDSRDGKKYKFVKIGEQTWMAENLDYEVSSSKCYDNDTKNCDKYGRLYDWNTAIKVCPEGWHLPTSSEWEELYQFASGGDASSGPAGRNLKAKFGWNDFEGKSGNGDDLYGFTALPSGIFSGRKNTFVDIGNGVWWWSVSVIDETTAHAYANHSKGEIAYRDQGLKTSFASVRCIQGVSKPAEQKVEKTADNILTDSRDGKKYKFVKIGEQTWMAENLNYHGSDGYLGLCYDKKPENCQKYGRLYDWSEAMGLDREYNEKIWGGDVVQHQGVCPSGWHLPTKDEWQVLVDFAGGEVAPKKLTAKTGWPEKICRYTKEDDRGRITKYDDCTDDYGFMALPGGYSCPVRGNNEYTGIGDVAAWWSSLEAKGRDIEYVKHRAIFSSGDAAFIFSVCTGNRMLLSVRCVKDDPAAKAAAKAKKDAEAKAAAEAETAIEAEAE